MPIERHIRVHRTARFYQLGMPGAATRELWVVCHGYGQLAASFAAALEPIDDASRVVVAPEALSRFYLDDPAKQHGPESPIGATWMTRADRDSEIVDYVEYLDSVASTVRREIGRDVPVVALGFSQGVATVCRWAALGGVAIQRLIVWGGTIPSDLPGDRGAQLFRGASVTLVAGTADRLVPLAAMKRDQQALAGRGVPARFVTHDGGHALSSATLRELASEAQ